MSKIPEGASRLSAQFGIRPNPIDKTFVVELKVNMPMNRVLIMNMDSKGIRDVMEMIERYEQEGWKPVEQQENSRR